jgi:anti-anti-sigma factor
MHLPIETIGDVTVVTVDVAELDAGNVDELRGALAPVLESCTKLVLDLGRVQFIDSRGCGAIVTCQKRLSPAGGDLKLCGVTPKVRMVFDLIRMQNVCEILETREAAVQAFRSDKQP